MKNPYLDYVEKLERWIDDGRKLPLGSMPPASSKMAANAPRALVFSPHPDDECIVGCLPLRLLREKGMKMVNVAVTQGSKRERQAGRWEELKVACAWLGFDLVATAEGGLENINPKGRSGDPARWKEACGRIRDIILEQKPVMIFLPHESDWNSTHIGTHLLVMDALAMAPASFSCRLVETEFWAPLGQPNLMVEASAGILADLMAGIACHVKEVERNPYHLTLPAWMQDNVRRGGEIVCGQGGAVPDFKFATLYRVRQWANGAVSDVWQGGKVAGMGDDLLI